MIIGYGTGRCGTKSLALFLNQQPGYEVTHEGIALPWYPALSEIPASVYIMTENQGDVAYYWLQYVNRILSGRGDARAIHIWREEEQVVASFWAYKQNQILMSSWKAYPFDHYEQSKDAIVTTVRRYMTIAKELKKRYRQLIYTMHISELNQPEALLEWLGIEDGNPTPVHDYNRRDTAPMQNPRPQTGFIP